MPDNQEGREVCEFHCILTPDIIRRYWISFGLPVTKVKIELVSLVGMAFAGNHHTGFPCLLDLDPYRNAWKLGARYFSNPRFLFC